MTNTASLLLETTKKMNYALSRRQYKKAYNLLQVKNQLHAELGKEPFTLPNLEARFN